MGWITPIAFLLCHTYSIVDAGTLETFSSKSVLSPERGALTGHFRKYLGFVCRATWNPISHRGDGAVGETVPALTLGAMRNSRNGWASIPTRPRLSGNSR